MPLQQQALGGVYAISCILLHLILPLGRPACYSFFFDATFAALSEKICLNVDRNKIEALNCMAIATPQSPIVKAARGSTDKSAMAMATTLFFMWGFLTALNDILVPHLKNIFDLNYTRVMLINSAFFGSYFLFAIPAGMLIERLG